MSKSHQVSEFNIEGRFLGFGFDGYKLKYLRLSNSEGESTIKIAKELRYSLAFNLLPGDWVQIIGEKKLDLKEDKLKLKAYSVTKIALNQSQTTIPTIIAPLVADPVTTKPKACILVCQKSDCWKRGGKEVCQTLQQEISDRGLADQVTVKQTGCMKHCKAAPNIVVNKTRYTHIQPEEVPEIIDKHFTPAPVLKNKREVLGVR